MYDHDYYLYYSTQGRASVASKFFQVKRIHLRLNSTIDNLPFCCERSMKNKTILGLSCGDVIPLTFKGPLVTISFIRNWFVIFQKGKKIKCIKNRLICLDPLNLDGFLVFLHAIARLPPKPSLSSFWTHPTKISCDFSQLSSCRSLLDGLKF